MSSKAPVEIADRLSRKRAAIVAVAAIAFLCVQIASYFSSGLAATDEIKGLGLTAWALNTLLLLAVLATGGGLVPGWKVRSLLNDELTLEHRRTAIVVGYWIAMATAVVLYVAPSFRTFTAREAIYLIVTFGVVTPLLTFAYLEYRAHSDAA